MRNLWCVAILMLGPACGSGGDGGVCDPGETRPCLCPGDLSGVQSCNSDGSGWGACDCLPVDSGTDAEDTVSPDTVEDTTIDTVVDDPVEDTIPDPEDDSPPCFEYPCGLKPNCGCPSGEKCSVDRTTGTRHCTSAGSLEAGDRCSSDGQCEIGTWCGPMWTDAGADESLCMEFCRFESDCPGDASICLGDVPGETAVGICTQGCDLLTGDPCPGGSKCYWMIATDDTHYTDCIADVGTGMLGDFCTGEVNCQRGHLCATSISECIGFCRISPPPDTCTSGCLQFTSGGSPVDILFDGVSYGYCLAS